MEALRREFMKERKMRESAVHSARVKTTINIAEMNADKIKMVQEIITNRKIQVYKQKLEETIKNASVPVPKRSIVVIDPVPFSSVPVKEHVVVQICQSKNLNGTPCKCKAKVGKFCLKHLP